MGKGSGPVVLAAILAGLMAMTWLPTAVAHPWPTVIMRNNATIRGFDPPLLEFDVGQNLTFENFDMNAPAHHPISNDDDPARLDGGGACFDAGVMTFGQDVTFVNYSTCSGLLSYRCNIHPWMRGWINADFV